MKKKKIIGLVYLSIIVLLVGNVAQGVSVGNPLQWDSFDELVGGLIEFLVFIGIPLSILSVLVGAFFILTSVGEPEKQKKGVNAIIYGVVGLGVILLGRALVALIKYLAGSA